MLLTQLVSSPDEYGVSANADILARYSIPNNTVIYQQSGLDSAIIKELPITTNGATLMLLFTVKEIFYETSEMCSDDTQLFANGLALTAFVFAYKPVS